VANSVQSTFALRATQVQNKARDDRWEVVLEEIFDWLDGESLLRVYTVCTSWRDVCRAQPWAPRRWERLIAKDFSVPIAESGELALPTAQPNSSDPPRWERRRPSTSTSPCSLLSTAVFGVFGGAAERNKSGASANRDVLRLGKTWCTLNKGWWATDGLECMDYCGKFYKAQVIGFDTRPWDAFHAPEDAIRPRLAVAPGCCRVKIHFEGWASRWDEWIVLPQEASRLRSRNPAAASSVGRDTRCHLGTVWELGIRDGEKGGERKAAVLGMGCLCDDAEGCWDLCFFLRYEDGRQEWLNLSKENERGRVTNCCRFYHF